MNPWLLAALVLVLLGLAPCLVVTLRGEPAERLIGLEIGSVVTTLVLLLLAQGFGRPAYVDVALLLAVLSMAGALVFARFLGRSL